MKLIHFIFTILCALLLSCKPAERTIQSENSTNQETETKVADKILFLNYKIIKINKSQLELSLINQIKNEGIIKGYSSNIQNLKEGSLKFVQLDENSIQLEDFYFENPLIKEFEFVNESGEFQRKSVKLDSLEFGIRIQLNPRCKHILTEEIIDSELNTRELLKIEVKK